MQSRSHPRGAPGVETDSRTGFPAGFRRAVGLLGCRQRLRLALLTWARIGVGFCDLALAAAMYLLFTLLQGRPPVHERWWIPRTIISAALFALIMVVVRATADVISSRLVLREIQRLYNDLLLRLTHGYSQMDWRRFVERNRSELSNHALNTAREAADFFHRCVELVAGIVVVIAMTGALFYESPIAAAGLAFTLLAFYLVHRFVIRKKVQEAASSREKGISTLHKSMADMLLAGREIRTYEREEFFLDRIRRQAEHVAASNQRAIFMPQISRIVADQGTVLLFLCMIVIVELRQGDPHQLLSLLAFYFVLSRRLLPLISQLSLIAGQMESSFENVRIVDSELKECREHATAKWVTKLPATGLVAELRWVNFWFHEDAPILLDTNLSLRQGETIVLRGQSGIGKSSLLDLIAGVLQPVSGIVRVDHSQVAYVPQDIPLLDDSIRRNLLFGLPEKSDETLMSVLALARLDELVAEQPLGLETCVGDNGILFSGGERQRLGLARAILRGGELFLLDEATSALDEENERRILENLTASGAAVVLVTHRLHAYEFAQREFRIERGRLIEVSELQSPGRSALEVLSGDIHV